MKMTQIAGVLGVCSLAGFAALPEPALAVSNTPIANLTERWNTGGSDGWAQYITGDNPGSVDWTNGGPAVAFAALTGASATPDQDRTYISADTSAAGSRFAGDYTARKISAVTFDIKVSNFSGSLSFYFMSADGYWWQRPIDPTQLPSDGTWGSVTIPIGYDGVWHAKAQSDSLAMMTNDLAAVTEIGVIVSRTGLQQETVLVDNFKLIGPWGQIIQSGPQAGLSAAWLAEHPLPPGKDGAADDADGDGMSNLAEFTAGTGANDASSVFTLNVGHNADGQTVLQWTPQPFHTYSVLQAPDLASSSFAAVAGLQSVATNGEVVVDTTGDGPYYFKVSVEQQVTP